MKRFRSTLINSIIALLSSLLLTVSLASCGSDSPKPEPKPEPEPDGITRTLIVYMPWSTNLTFYFKRNLEDIEEAFRQTNVEGQRLIVYFASSATQAELYELKKDGDKIEHATIKHYTDPAVNTAEGVKQVMTDAKNASSTSRYSMIIGCHGMGWVPKQSSAKSRQGKPLYHWDMTGMPLTRFFGGLQPQYQIDIDEFAEGVSGAGISFDYILFDDCYMANVETAYELRDITDYLIASTSEIMAIGMPYPTMLPYLLGEPDYQKAVDAFITFYSSYTDPYGTISVTDCREIEPLAAAMLRINSSYEFDEARRGELQKLDGYTPPIFYDFGDYVCKLTGSTTLPAGIEMLLDNAVKAKAHTPSYYSTFTGPNAIHTFSGLTISDPSVNSQASNSKRATGWWEATHSEQK